MRNCHIYIYIWPRAETRGHALRACIQHTGYPPDTVRFCTTFLEPRFRACICGTGHLTGYVRFNQNVVLSFPLYAQSGYLTGYQNKKKCVLSLASSELLYICSPDTHQIPNMKATPSNFVLVYAELDIPPDINTIHSGLNFDPPDSAGGATGYPPGW